MDEFRGTPIETREAMEMLANWSRDRREIGVIFWGQTANVYTVGRVSSAASGRIEVLGEGARATFRLDKASFRFGPMQTWPHWPSGPVVTVTALRAEFENGEYLALAEGLTPTPTIGTPALPE